MATSSLVLDLQAAALDEHQSVSSVLRKAKVVASKLNLTDALSWIDAELSGYESELDVPDYRKLTVSVEALNPYYGWQKVQFDDRLREIFTQRALSAGVPLLEEYTDRARQDPKARLILATPQSGVDLIHSEMPIKLRVESFADISICKHVTAAVRARVLDWSLELEKEGVLGEGMTFSESEKRQAAQVPQINIGSIANLAGSIGGVISDQSINASQVISSTYSERVLRSLASIEEYLKASEDSGTSEVFEAIGAARAEAQRDNVDESLLKATLRKIPAAAVSLSNYAVQAFVTAEIGKLITGH